MNQEAKLRAYARRGHRAVQGWLDPIAINIIETISARQVALGISGGVCEIGIHHGRLFILLHLLSRGDERAAAYDLFEMQAENVDASGRGDKAIFLENLRTHGCDLARIVVKSLNSLQVLPAEVLADAGPVRLFSVDGGHTADTTTSDVALAEASLAPGGVVILDDYFNEAWPGVAEGAMRHLRAGSSGLVPVCIGGNKFIFTNTLDFARRYQAELLGLRAQQYLVKESEAFGNAVLIVQPKITPLAWRLASTAFWKQVKGTAIGRALKAVALRILPR